jgi:hypothetical protein
MFFEISLNTINLFSIMIGMSLVVLSSLWNGRIRCTRIVFVYLAGLAFYYGAIKQNISVDKPITPVVQYTQQPNLNARVPPITEITGKNRK